MHYPYFLLQNQTPVFPLFGDVNKGDPFIFDFSDDNPETLELDERDQIMMTKYITRKLGEAKADWGVGGYLQRRANLLRFFPQIVGEERFFHLGLDITAPLGATLFAPLAGTLVESGYEKGEGNYGGYAVLKHTGNFDTFYSFYGHLSPETVVQEGTELKAGEPFARLGDYDQNGNWFYHTHLQVLTEKGYGDGFVHKGYCTEKMIATIGEYAPSPLFLLRY